MEFLWIVLLAAALVAAGVGIYMLIRKKKSGAGTAGALAMSFQTKPSIIEFGASESLTPMFHELCRQKGRPILTVDQSAWSKTKFANLYSQEWHPFRIVNPEQRSRLARSADGWGIAIISARDTRNIVDLRRHADVVMITDMGMFDNPKKIGAAYKYRYYFAPDVMLLSDTIDVQKIGGYFFNDPKK